MICETTIIIFSKAYLCIFNTAYCSLIFKFSFIFLHFHEGNTFISLIIIHRFIHWPHHDVSNNLSVPIKQIYLRLFLDNFMTAIFKLNMIENYFHLQKQSQMLTYGHLLSYHSFLSFHENILSQIISYNNLPHIVIKCQGLII